MNNDSHLKQLRQAIESAGITVRQTTHPSSLRVWFTTSPPLTWSFAQCDRATESILNSLVDDVKIGDVFSTDHDRIHSYWAFRQEMPIVANP